MYHSSNPSPDPSSSREANAAIGCLFLFPFCLFWSPPSSLLLIDFNQNGIDAVQKPSSRTDNKNHRNVVDKGLKIKVHRFHGRIGVRYK